MVHPNQVHLYAPPPGHDQALYAQAQRDNPDPSCMVPVLALGFPDLKKRIEMQSDQSALHLEKLNVSFILSRKYLNESIHWYVSITMQRKLNLMR